jgi:hypothetical protein
MVNLETLSRRSAAVLWLIVAAILGIDAAALAALGVSAGGVLLGSLAVACLGIPLWLVVSPGRLSAGISTVASGVVMCLAFTSWLGSDSDTQSADAAIVIAAATLVALSFIAFRTTSRGA